MATSNKEIAGIISQLADYMELNDESEFRIRSYRNAAESISDLSESLQDKIKREENLSKLPDVGESTAEKIKEIVETGKLKRLEELKQQIPIKIEEFDQIDQLGPERIKALYNELGITDVKSLTKATNEGKIAEVKGFGKKMQEKIQKEVKELDSGAPERFLWEHAEEIITPFFDYLKKEKHIKKIEIAGSYRRKKETVGDIDMVASSKNAEKLIDRFVNYENVKEVIAKGKTKSSVILRSGLQVDIRVVPDASFGAAFLYFTGSRPFTLKMRKMAQKQEEKINEYGIYKGKKKLAGRTEKEMLNHFKLKYIEPELREDRGEIDAASNNSLPNLITLKDIRGDLQTHSTHSDGKYDIEDMVNAAKELGYNYYAITDHSKRVAMANGMDEKRLGKQIDEINELNEKISGIRILKAIEVDILENGKLDLSDDILKELDVVVCSIHYNRNLSRKKQTSRVLKAMDNKYFNIFAHPTGRKINARKPYEIDLETIMKEAKKKGCYLELNATPDRLDLSDANAKMAKEMGVKLSISTDAHTVNHLRNMRHGVAQGRRAWLEKDDVINTRPWSKLKKLLQR